MEFEKELLKEIRVFENFLKNIGFKRVDGAIYGLLVLSRQALSSEEIEKILGLSQSSISLSLKQLAHFGAVESFDCREKRCQLHAAREDSLSIVATVFKKREQELIEDMKEMARRTRQFCVSVGENQDSDRFKRLSSIVAGCEMAEAIMSFVIALSHVSKNGPHHKVLKKLPEMLNFILQSDNWPRVADSVKSTLSKKVKEQLMKFT